MACGEARPRGARSQIRPSRLRRGQVVAPLGVTPSRQRHLCTLPDGLRHGKAVGPTGLYPQLVPGVRGALPLGAANPRLLSQPWPRAPMAKVEKGAPTACGEAKPQGRGGRRRLPVRSAARGWQRRHLLRLTHRLSAGQSRPARRQQSSTSRANAASRSPGTTHASSAGGQTCHRASRRRSRSGARSRGARSSAIHTCR